MEKEACQTEHQNVSVSVSEGIHAIGMSIKSSGCGSHLSQLVMRLPGGRKFEFLGRIFTSVFMVLRVWIDMGGK